MRNIDPKSKIWKGRMGRLWRLADRMYETSEAIRYAEKPYDLVFPITRMIALVNQAREMQWEWLAEKIGLNKQNYGRWPSL
jgi:hypothetical protein